MESIARFGLSWSAIPCKRSAVSTAWGKTGSASGLVDVTEDPTEAEDDVMDDVIDVEVDAKDETEKVRGEEGTN